MDDPDRNTIVTLSEALLIWTDADLVEKVRQRERTHTFYELAGTRRPRLAPDGELRQPKKDDWKVGGSDFTLLNAAWRALEHDFRTRVSKDELFLSGVKTKPELATVSQAIPGAWAFELKMDFVNNVVAVADQRFANITVSPKQPTYAVERQSSEGGVPPITPENIRELTDEEVLLLLEDHARRVVEGPDAKLIAPGKISVMPIIKRKMLHRAERRETRETLAAESAELARWIATKVTSHQVPFPDSIKNALRNDYRSLKPQSKGIKP